MVRNTYLFISVSLYVFTIRNSGQSIAVAHDPPRITLHSIQDGQEERVLLVGTPSNILRRPFRIRGVLWFQEEQNVTSSSIPDMFKRNNIIVRDSFAGNVWSYI